jgi:hypothetical protein
VHTGINDTGGKFATDVNDTGGKYWKHYQTADTLKNYSKVLKKFYATNISANFWKIRNNGPNGILWG